MVKPRQWLPIVPGLTAYRTRSPIGASQTRVPEKEKDHELAVPINVNARSHPSACRRLNHRSN
jgi:hypothetical protein